MLLEDLSEGGLIRTDKTWWNLPPFLASMVFHFKAHFEFESAGVTCTGQRQAWTMVYTIDIYTYISMVDPPLHSMEMCHSNKKKSQAHEWLQVGTWLSFSGCWRLSLVTLTDGGHSLSRSLFFSISFSVSLSLSVGFKILFFPSPLGA